MTLEELQAELDKANKSIDALSDKNKEILDEKKKMEKKYKEVDTDEYFKLRDDFDNLQGEHKKLEKANGVLTKDLEKSNATITERDGSLRQLVVTDGIAKALNGLEKHKLNDGALALATLDIESKGVSLNDDGQPMIGDKSMSDYITTDWISSSSSKNLVTANENSGGGAGGGNNSGGQNIDRKDMSPDQMMTAGRK